MTRNLITRRKLIKLAAPALILSKQPAHAWTHGFSSSPPAIPSFATAFGINQVLIWDGFDSIRTIDVNNTLLPGPFWYLCNISTFQGSPLSPVPAPAPPNYYNVSGGVLSITQMPYDTGYSFSTMGYIPNTYPPQQLVNTLPYISGSKPFYLEGNLQYYPNVHQAFWVEDVIAFNRSVNNQTGVTGAYAEFDMFEVQTNVANQNWKSWIAP